MNRKMVLTLLRRLLGIEGLLMIAPIIVSIIYGESFFAFLVVALALVLIGFVFNKTPKNTEIYAKEGFILVGLTWVCWSIFGALPFVISGSIPNFFDAFFETASGFTTTGSSILTDIESLSHGMLFWRSFTHWVGGMGVLVFMLALVPMTNGNGLYIMKAEMPGPTVDKLVPKAIKTAQILYKIYFAMTAIMIVLLFVGGMPLFDSFVNAFGTAGTGGFAVKNAGIAAYNSPYAEIVMTVFMVLFSINFNLYYLLLIGKFRPVFKNAELKVFLAIFIGASLLIAVNIYNTIGSVADTLRLSTFQVASIMSTSGFTTADFALWPEFSQGLLFVLMLLGACAGSTGGGFKVVRLILSGKIMKRDLKRIAKPREISKIRMDGMVVDEDTVNGIKTYALVYFMIIIISYVLLLFDGKDILTTGSSVITCFNNIGPGLGNIVGPTGNFSSWSSFAKVVLSFDMIMGRLELFPILMLFMPSLWRKKSL